jgi:hypothetical protein
MFTAPLRRPAVVLTAAACCFFMIETSAAPIALDCKMKAPVRVRVGEPVLVTFELHNRSGKTLHVLMRNTPFEGFLGRFLTITGPQGELAYGGAMVKRGPPLVQEYLHIGNNAKRRRTLNLAEVYQFGAPGQYRIQYTGDLSDVTSAKSPAAQDKLAPHALQCADVMVDVVAK